METATYDPNGLLAGEKPILQRAIVLSSGQNLKRGAVLGRITATDEYVLSLTASNDGSEVPAGVLAIDCDATAADKNTTAFFSGEFNAAKLVFGTGHTAATVEAAFRKAGLPMAVRTLP